MFDIGFWELALIGVVTLLVVGPERLPGVARTAGQWVAKTRRFVAGVRADFNRELQSGDLHKLLGEQRDEINELRSLVQSTRKELETTTSDAVKAAKTGFESLEKAGKAAENTIRVQSGAAAGAAEEATAKNTETDAERAERQRQEAQKLADQANLLDDVSDVSQTAASDTSASSQSVSQSADQSSSKDASDSSST